MTETASRLGVAAQKDALGYVFKTVHLQHGGKLSLTRLLAGHLDDGATLHSPQARPARVSGIYAVSGATTASVRRRRPATRSRSASSTASRPATRIAAARPRRPRWSRSNRRRRCSPSRSRPNDRKDDVKLGQAMLRLNEEDPSLTMVHNPRTHDIVLWGQGEMHLRVALERLRERFGVNVKSHAPAIGYQETIRKSVTQRGRHKKQSGGHGQFGDVVLEIKPLPRGEGFEFDEKVVGGAVPRNYIGAVEEGVRDGLLRGPLGFPVIDVAGDADRRLLSQRRFFRSGVPHRGAHRRERSAAAVPAGPAGADLHGRDRLSRPTPPRRSTRSCRRGAARSSASIPARAGRAGTASRAMMPEAEIGDLIVELRSATAGAGGFTRQFDRMAEVIGRAADQIIAAHRDAA